MPTPRGQPPVPPRRIALVNYPFSYFDNFGDALGEAGFGVYWVAQLHSDSAYHASRRPEEMDHVLDITRGFTSRPELADRYRAELAPVEEAGGLNLNDIILMDRVLRNKSYGFAISYLHHVATRLRAFIETNSITLLTSGRDSALQLMSRSVGMSMGVPWVVPTRLRIPDEWYFFCSAWHSDSVIETSSPSDDDRAWAGDFVRAARSRMPKPVSASVGKSLPDIVRALPTHARAFQAVVKTARHDHGNDFSRYTVPHIVSMYLRRRSNMVRLLVKKPYYLPDEGPFCLYALHTQPESSIDVAGSPFTEQVALIKHIVRLLPVTHRLYVKIHPENLVGRSLEFYREVAQIPGVRLIAHHVNTVDLVRRAAIVFTVTGTIGYEAGILGKPVVIFARTYYVGLPTVHYYESFDHLRGLVQRLLAGDQHEEDTEKATSAEIAFLKAQCWPGEVNRAYLPSREKLGTADLRTLQQAYSRLHEVLVVQGQR